MNIISAYLKGWSISLKHLKMWSLLYALNIIFSLLLIFPLFQFFEQKLATTVAMDKLYEQFDFSIFNDILNEYGDIASIFFNQGLLHSLVFLLLSIFLVGGILSTFKSNTAPFQFSVFLVGCIKYFWRILGLTFLFLVFHIALLALFFFIFQTLTAGGLAHFNSEVEIYNRAMLLLPFYLFFGIVFFMIQDYAKVSMVNEELSLFRSIAKGINFVFKNFLPTFLLYLLNALTFGILFYLYWHISTGNVLLVSFIIGQIFLIFRIGTKLSNLASATVLYETYK